MTDEAQAPRDDSEAAQIKASRREFALALRACSPKERGLVRALPEHRYQLWRAAEKLGISKHGVQLMRARPRFQRAISALNALLDLQTIVAHHRVLREYECLAHSSLKDFYDENGELLPPAQWTDEMAAAVQERSFDKQGRPQIKLHEKKGALDAIAKYLKMAPDRVELTGKDGGPIKSETNSPTLADFYETVTRIPLGSAAGAADQPGALAEGGTD